MLHPYQIQQFNDSLGNKTNSDINSFLIKLGEFLRLNDPEEIEPETILRTVDLLYSIHEKLFSEHSEQNLSDKIENLIIQCKGTGAFLRNKIRKNQYDKNYYIDIAYWGREIVELAHFLSILGISIFNI